MTVFYEKLLLLVDYQILKSLEKFFTIIFVEIPNSVLRLSAFCCNPFPRIFFLLSASPRPRSSGMASAMNEETGFPMNVVCQSSLARAGQDDKSNPQSWKRIFGSGTAVEEQERAAAAKFKSHLFPSSASLYLGKVETPPNSKKIPLR